MSAGAWPSLGVAGHSGAACIAVVRRSALAAACGDVTGRRISPGIRQEMHIGAVRWTRIAALQTGEGAARRRPPSGRACVRDASVVNDVAVPARADADGAVMETLDPLAWVRSLLRTPDGLPRTRWRASCRASAPVISGGFGSRQRAGPSWSVIRKVTASLGQPHRKASSPRRGLRRAPDAHRITGGPLHRR